MSVKQIGKQLVAFCRKDENLACIDALYADDVESIEAGETQGGFARVTRGKAAVRAKNVKWGDEQQIHQALVEGPYPHGEDRFAVRFAYDVTNKASGQRFQMDEVAVFTVKDGKIAKEEFFYDMGG